MQNKPSIVFFGTDEFAVIVLEMLIEAGFDVVAVVTPPDEPAGKKKVLKPSPVKVAALSFKLSVLQPAKLKNFEMPICDLGVVVVYGKIIPGKLLKTPKHGFLNIHPSLLPKYRGPSPIKTAIANGDTETGVTIIELDSEMDHGPVVGNTKYQIPNDKLHIEIRDELAELGASLLINIIPDYIAGKIKAVPQDHSQATHTALLNREDGKVDLEKDSPESIYNKFRAYHDWPGLFTYQKSNLKNQNLRVKILDCKLVNGNLEITEVQPEGKNPMSLKDFENGYGKLYQVLL